MAMEETDGNHQESFSAGQCDAAMGESIRRTRERRKITRGDLAKKLALSESDLADVEAGRASISFATVRRAALALGLSVIQLVVAAEAALTGKSRVAVEIDLPDMEVNGEAAANIAKGYAALHDPQYRGVIETLIAIFKANQEAASETSAN